MPWKLTIFYYLSPFSLIHFVQQFFKFFFFSFLNSFSIQKLCFIMTQNSLSPPLKWRNTNLSAFDPCQQYSIRKIFLKMCVNKVLNLTFDCSNHLKSLFPFCQLNCMYIFSCIHNVIASILNSFVILFSNSVVIIMFNHSHGSFLKQTGIGPHWTNANNSISGHILSLNTYYRYINNWGDFQLFCTTCYSGLLRLVDIATMRAKYGVHWDWLQVYK